MNKNSYIGLVENHECPMQKTTTENIGWRFVMCWYF